MPVIATITGEREERGCGMMAAAKFYGLMT
jgi:hypothetical protein